MTLPYWLKNKTPKKRYIDILKGTLKGIEVNSVCESAKCPNIGECFSQGKITFMILGNVCTRNCSFCGVEKGHAESVNENEPKEIARAVRRLGIKHVVITSVTRDDLNDFGAGQFIKVIEELRKHDPKIFIEILIPDFKGNEKIIRKIIESKPDVFNHNIETVERLYYKVRPAADYYRSLKVLSVVSNYSEKVITKSGLMVGLGETMGELEKTFADLKDNGCEIVTIGQYLRPSKEQMEVVEYISPEKFIIIKETAEKYDFRKVLTGPFIRSSYQAEEVLSK